MKEKLIILNIKTLYKSGLRNLLIKAIADPEEKWDDHALQLLDFLMEYDQKPSMFKN